MDLNFSHQKISDDESARKMNDFYKTLQIPHIIESPEFVTTKGISTVLIQLKEAKEPIRKLDFSWNRLTDIALDLLGDELSCHSSLNYLSISSNSIQKWSKIEEFLEKLMRLPSLKKVYFGDNPACVESEIEKFLAKLDKQTGTAWRNVFINDVSGSDSNKEEFAPQTSAEAASASASVTVNHSHKPAEINTAVDDAAELAPESMLTSSSIGSSNFVSPRADEDALGDSFSSSSSARGKNDSRSLNCSQRIQRTGSNKGDLTMQEVIDTIQARTNWQKLDLSNNSLSDDEMLLVMEAIKRSRGSLSYWSLANNNLSENVIVEILHTLVAGANKLRSVDIRGNPGCGEGVIERLCKLCGNSKERKILKGKILWKGDKTWY